MSFQYDVTVNYVEAHEECLELITQIVFHENIIERLKREVRQEVKHAENMIYNELEENFSEVTKAIQHRRGGYYLINKMRNFVQEMIHHGQIEVKEAEYFLHNLNKESRNLELGKLKINFEEAETDFTTNSELTKIFSKSKIEELCQSFKEISVDHGEIIIKKGQVIKNLYYLSKGIVHEK